MGQGGGEAEVRNGLVENELTLLPTFVYHKFPFASWGRRKIGQNSRNDPL